MTHIIGGNDSPLAGMVRLIPIERLNAVLAISPQAKYLSKLQTWVERLDQPNETTDQRLFVYHVQNGRASDIASVLTKVLLGQNGQQSPGVTPHGAGLSRTQQDSLSTSNGGTLPVPQNPNTSIIQNSIKELQGGSDATDRSASTLKITSDEVNNSIVILATAAEYKIIESALQQIDIAPLQVLLEASVAEVTLTNQLKYGVQYYFNINGKNKVTLSNSSSSSITTSFPGLNYQFIDGNNINAIISALDSLTHVDVISSPQVLVLNNQTATLQVGDQVPIATQQAQSTLTSDSSIINSITYHDTGVILKVTPRVNQGGMVMMDISQEVSEVSTTTSSNLDSPTISERKISSTVAVHDGETVALGGLITSSKTKSNSGVPFLKDVPILGNLFGTTNDQGSRTELLVMITPHVVDSLQRARSVTEELRARLPAVRPLFQRVQ